MESGDLARDCDLLPPPLVFPLDAEAALVALAGGCVNGHEPRLQQQPFGRTRDMLSHSFDNAHGVSAYLRRFIQPKDYFDQRNA